MKKCRKRFLYVILAVVLTALQLSGPVSVLAAESKTLLKVSDIGDEALYAVLAKTADPSGAYNGNLYKEDAQKITSINFSSGYQVKVSDIKSFANFAKYCPNLESLYTHDYESEAAKLSLAQEIAKMEKLQNLQFTFYAQEDGSCPEFDTICNKTNKEKLKFFSVRIQEGSFDMGAAAKFTGLTKLTVYINSDVSVTMSQAVAKMTALKQLEVTSYQEDGAEFQKIADALPSTVEKLTVKQNKAVDGGVSLDISKLTGLKSISFRGINILKGLYDLPNLTSIDALGSSSDKLYIDLTRLPKKLTRLRLEDCIVSGNEIKGVPDTMEQLIVEDSGITKVEDLSHCTNLDYFIFNGNELTSIPDLSGLELTYFEANDNQITDISKMKDCKKIYYMEMENNQITNISALKNIEILKKAILSHNRISDISALTGKTQLEELDLSYNRIQTLPDMTALTNIAGETYYGEYKSFEADGKYRLSLKGNKLTKATLQGKVPQTCTDDKYWVYAATMQSTGKGTAYFTELNTDMWTALFNNYYRQTVYTTQQSLTLDKDVIDLMKSKNAQLEIYYIYNDNVVDKVTVKASSLPSGITSVPITFENTVTGTTNSEIEAAFGKYGKSCFYYEVPQRTVEEISGVTYSTEVDLNVLDANKIYHEYIYNKANQTFYYNGTYSNKTSVESNQYSSGLGDYYFIVEDSQDMLMHTDVYSYTASDGQERQTYETYYRQIDDAVILGWLLDNGNHSYGYGHYVNADSISFSAETAQKLSENSAFYNIYRYDPKTHSSSSSVMLTCDVFENQSYTIPLPKVTTTTDASALSVEFTGGTPERIYKLDEALPDISGVTYYINVYGFDRSKKNVYTCYEESPILLSQSNTTERIELPYNAEPEYFTISPEKDTYNKTVTTETGKTLTYLTDTSSAVLRKNIQFKMTHQDVKRQNYASMIFNVIGSNMTLDADTIAMMKASDVYTQVMFRFYSLKTGNLQSELKMVNNRLRNSSEGIKIEKPQVEFSDSNAKFEALLPSGLSPVYVTNKAYMAKDVQYYYCDPDVVDEIFTDDKYDVLGISASNTIFTQESSANVTNRLRLIEGTGAVVLSSAYEEAKKNETTKPTESTTEATKPTEAPTEVTKPTEKPTQAPTEATKPTQATKPTEAPTEVTKPTEKPTQKPTQATTESTTQSTTEAPKPTQKPTEAPTEVTKPTEAPTEVTKPTEKPTEAPTEVTKPDNTVTDDTPHMENGSDGKKYWYENGIKQGTEGNGKEIYDPATDAWYWLDAVQGGAVATDKDVNIPDGTENGKWVRYDSEGRMVKGEDYRYGGWYYFDETTGAMTKGFINIADGTDEGKWVYYDEINGQMHHGDSEIAGNSYHFDETTGKMIHGAYTNADGTPCYYDDITGIGVDCSFKEQGGQRYWYESGQRQGLKGRGKEIYDAASNAWYWLDAVQNGAVAVSKDVYQESWAGAFADREDGTGKWVRYDENGHMIKSWSTQNGNVYYFDEQTGAMAKGTVEINGQTYTFDWATGILQF